jgi:hypothetical protein
MEGVTKTVIKQSSAALAIAAAFVATTALAMMEAWSHPQSMQAKRMESAG